MYNFALTQIKLDYTEGVVNVTITAQGELEINGINPTVTISDNQIVTITFGELEISGINPTITVEVTPTNPKYIFIPLDRTFIFKAPIRQFVFEAPDRQFIFKDKKHDNRF